eukprot:12495425-Alexandrium_andersonii.AAC.1
MVPVRPAWVGDMLVLVDVQPDRVEDVEQELGLARWASRRLVPSRLQMGPLEGGRELTGRSLRLHPPHHGPGPALALGHPGGPPSGCGGPR